MQPFDSAQGRPAPEEIRVQLDRILSSDAFANADRLSRFLRYVIEKTLAGHGDQLKEYVIGTEVFDRGERYDPRLDSIVRVEAGRLRAKLEEYYNRQGVNDAVLVRIPRGSYAPAFERRHTATSAGTALRRRLAAGVAAGLLLTGIVVWSAGRWIPSDERSAGITIAVLPFKSYSTDESVALLAARLTDGVTSELARLGTVGVVSHTSALQFAGVRRPLKEVAESLNANVVMEASLSMEGTRVQVQTRLVDAATDRKFWVEDFAADATALVDVQRRIAAAAAEAATRARR